MRRRAALGGSWGFWLSRFSAGECAQGRQTFEVSGIFGFRGLGFGGLGFRVWGFRGLGFRGLRFGGLRCRELWQTLPRIRGALGQGVGVLS